MKTRVIVILFLFSGIIGISGCGGENRELKKDAKKIAEAMCKNIDAMKNLQSVNPEDSNMVQKLQLEYKKVEAEITSLNEKFKTKYGDRTTSAEFKENFRKYLSEAMLDCKSLSKEDRESFEKGMK